MDHTDAHDMFVKLYDELGADEFLNSLYLAMSTDEAVANFEYIARMHDIEL